MKNYLILSLLFSFVLFAEGPLRGQESDKTESPYFQITSQKGSFSSLPLLSTIADVKIAGVIADVTVTQKYQNNGDQPIEAIYVFPTSTHAAVYHMEMTIGKRIIQAEIKEKSKAKKMYESAKKHGQRASLLEQNRPNIFTMNVANIQPTEIIEVTLKYTEDLIPKNGTYSFIYPTVVGPRYEGKNMSSDIPDPKNYLPQNTPPTYHFDINIALNGGMPLQSVTSETHVVDVIYEHLSEAKVTLDTSEKFGGNRDFVLDYQLSGDQISTGLLVHQGEKENYFMMTIQPPKVVTQNDIPNQEFIFVVDVSGSMHGFPLNISKGLMRNLLTNLREDDLFNVMLFAGTASTFATGSVPVQPTYIDKALQWIDNTHGSGGTELLHALNKAINLPRSDSDRARSIVIISDGYISVEHEVYDLIRAHKSEFNIYALGIGSAPNRFLMEGIAHMGNTQALIIKDQKEAAQKAEDFRQMIAHPILTNVVIDWGSFDVYDLEPSNINDLLSHNPIVIKGKYKGAPNGIIHLEGISGQSNYSSLHPISKEQIKTDNSALKYLWARKRIQLLDDYAGIQKTEELQNEITQLGLQYNLLTNYTSFVAIDYEKVMAQDGTSVKQILPLPKGVSNRAIGTQNNYAMGAELMISNPKKSTTNSGIKIQFSRTKLNSIQLQFAKIELIQKIEKLRSLLCEEQIERIKLNFKVNDQGIITNLFDTNYSISPITFNKIVKEVNTWRLKYCLGQTVSVSTEIEINRK